MDLPACPHTVTVARHAVSELAERAGFEPALADDIRLAVTEACTNVVRHAYGERTGTLALEADWAEDGLRVEVRDTGCGAQPQPSPEGPGLGLGLIAALAPRHEIEVGPAGGRTVRMFFAPARG